MSKEDKKQEILDAASELFLRYGYRKTTLDDVANAVRIRKSTLYHYFNNKEDLFRMTVKTIHDQLCNQFSEIIRNNDDLQVMLVELANAHRENMEIVRPAKEVLIGEVSEFLPIVEDIFIETKESLFNSLKTKLDDAISNGILKPFNTEIAARTLWVIIEEVFGFRPLFDKCYQNMIEDPTLVFDFILRPYYINA